MKLTLKRRLTSIVWPKYSKSIDAINKLPRFVELMFEEVPEKIVDSKSALHQWVAEYVGQTKPITYLEFGVATGKSMEIWLSKNNHPDSKFFGFDSFEGLPENWSTAFPKGTFASGGNPPNLKDRRLEFVIGWFQESLPAGLQNIQSNNRRVIHHDADLYTSTLYCLTKTDHLLQSGSIIILDDFSNILHVNEAFRNYKSAFHRKFRFLCSTPRLTTVVFEVY